MREQKESINLANAGVGAASHLCGLLLQSAVQTQVTTIPYRGTGPAMTDLIGGTVDLMCDQTTNTTQQIRSGAVRAFAVTTAERNAALPDLPTAAEAGLPGFEVSVWHGLYAPKGTRRGDRRPPLPLAPGRAARRAPRRPLRRARHHAGEPGARHPRRAPRLLAGRHRQVAPDHPGRGPIRRLNYLLLSRRLPRHT